MPPAVDILEGGVVGRDEACPRPTFDRHVADRHALFHRQGADRLAGVFEHVARPTADADTGDEREDDVLRRDARGEPAIDPDLVRLRLALEQRLRGQHHLDFGRPDAEGERAERAMRRGVRIAAHDRHAGLRQAELRADDMDDPLAGRTQAVKGDPELAAVVGELLDLRGSHRVEDRQRPIVRGNRVVRGRDGPLGVSDAEASGPEPRERLGQVTSWTRWRSTARTAGAPGSWATTWSSQIFSTRVRGRVSGIGVLP